MLNVCRLYENRKKLARFVNKTPNQNRYFNEKGTHGDMWIGQRLLIVRFMYGLAMYKYCRVWITFRAHTAQRLGG